MSLPLEDLTQLIDHNYASSVHGQASIPLSLPLLDFLDDITGIREKELFKGWSCILIHHVLGSLIPVVELLRGGGINREDINIIGKAYSSHPAALNRLQESGYNARNAYAGYDATRPYDDILIQEIRTALRQTLKTPKKRILVLDDGGKALGLIEREFANESDRIRGVELTSRGANALIGAKLRFPVINVARSTAKSLVESRVIAQSMVTELQKCLLEWRYFSALDGAQVLLRGYGALGRQIAILLRDTGSLVHVAEKDNIRLAAAAESGFRVADNTSNLSQADFVLGCTGVARFPLLDLRRLKESVLLVSMGSSDLEFMPWRFSQRLAPVRLTPGRDPSEFAQARHAPWGYLFRLNLRKSRIFLANGGFPIDFSGELDPIPPSLIQLTRALLVAGAVQATSSQGTGLIPLDEGIQRSILGKFLDVLSDQNWHLNNAQ